jgi:hypothetical protein
VSEIAAALLQPGTARDPQARGRIRRRLSRRSPRACASRRGGGRPLCRAPARRRRLPRGARAAAAGRRAARIQRDAARDAGAAPAGAGAVHDDAEARPAAGCAGADARAARPDGRDRAGARRAGALPDLPRRHGLAARGRDLPADRPAASRHPPTTACRGRWPACASGCATTTPDATFAKLGLDRLRLHLRGVGAGRRCCTNCSARPRRHRARRQPGRSAAHAARPRMPAARPASRTRKRRCPGRTAPSPATGC